MAKVRSGQSIVTAIKVRLAERRQLRKDGLKQHFPALFPNAEFELERLLRWATSPVKHKK
jgi:hypothetical protein